MINFLGWDKPAVDLVAGYLLACLNNGETADEFRRATVVVPTAESGRRLRERLPELAGRPVLIPKVCQAVHLVRVEGAADELVELAAWIKVLGAGKPHELWPALFPAPPVNLRNWCSGMARQMMQLRRRLDDACLTPARIATDAEEEHEKSRWEEIESIFQDCDACLAEWGYKPASVCYAAAQREALDYYAGRTIIVACLPQMSARFRLFLDAVVAAGGRVIICVNAPADYRRLFDSRYGLPLTDWGEEKQNISDSDIAVVADGAGMAQTALQECSGCESDTVALGCCDSSFAPVLRNAFENAGWRLNLPEGRSFLTTEAGQWMQAMQRALGQPESVVAVAALLRNETMQRCCGLKNEQRYHLVRWMDKELSERLPCGMKQLLADARALCPDSPGGDFVALYVEKVQGVMSRLAKPELLPAELRKLAAAVVRAYHGSPQVHAMEAFAEMLQQISTLVERVPEFCNAGQALSFMQSCTAQHALGSLGLVATPREATALDASGWMELPYCSGTRLVLCGLHEHCVPEPPSVDAFLPESLCRRYSQLPGMQQRVARDNFMLTALLSAYRGSLRIIVARNTDDGTPVVPSQLLLRCPADPPEALIRRVELLFSELAPSSAGDDGMGWRMRTPALVLPGLEDISLLGDNLQNPWPNRKDYFSPSKLASFLACPLRFWLKELLAIDPQDAYDAGKTALDAMEYGTLMHAALEGLVKKFPVASADATRETMQLFAREQVEIQFTRYGRKLSLPLAAQRRMMENNVLLFVDAHLNDLADGWETVHLEYKTEQSGWKLDGRIPFHMTLDRVDRRRKPDGKGYYWRVIDYKTGSSKPKDKHLDKVSETTAACFSRFLPELPLLPLPVRKDEIGLYRWKEVQLPLYAQWLMDTYDVPLEDISVAYYLMPRSKKSCTYEPWELTAEMQTSALDWVRAAVGMILDGRCLLSAESLGLTAYADFGALAPEGDPRRMMGLPELTLTPDC